MILVTASAGKAVSQSLGGLRRGGTVVALGASPDPIEASSGDLLFNTKKLVGALTGNPAAGDHTLKFSVLTGVAPMVELHRRAGPGTQPVVRILSAAGT